MDLRGGRPVAAPLGGLLAVFGGDHVSWLGLALSFCFFFRRRFSFSSFVRCTAALARSEAPPPPPNGSTDGRTEGGTREGGGTELLLLLSDHSGLPTAQITPAVAAVTETARADAPPRQHQEPGQARKTGFATTIGGICCKVPWEGGIESFVLIKKSPRSQSS